MKKLLKNRLAFIGLCVIFLIGLAAVFAPYIAPYDPDGLSMKAIETPSFSHPFGTDDFGRDILSRAVYGARVSLAVGIVAVSISTILGMAFGILSGYFGGYIDSIIMRFVDVMMAFPSIFLILAIQVMFTPNILNVMAVIGATSWMGVARLFRAEILSVKERPFVESARALGASNLRLMLRHILPNSLSSVIVAATLGVAGAILTESALSFLGMGVQPPFASWGNMLQDSQAYMLDAPWMAIVPGALIFITVLSVYFLGEGLRETLNPKGR